MRRPSVHPKARPEISQASPVPGKAGGARTRKSDIGRHDAPLVIQARFLGMSPREEIAIPVRRVKSFTLGVSTLRKRQILGLKSRKREQTNKGSLPKSAADLPTFQRSKMTGETGRP